MRTHTKEIFFSSFFLTNAVEYICIFDYFYISLNSYIIFCFIKHILFALTVKFFFYGGLGKVKKKIF